MTDHLFYVAVGTLITLVALGIPAMILIGFMVFAIRALAGVNRRSQERERRDQFNMQQQLIEKATMAPGQISQLHAQERLHGREADVRLERAVANQPLKPETPDTDEMEPTESMARATE